MKIPGTYTGKGMHEMERGRTADTYMKLVSENSEIV